MKEIRRILLTTDFSETAAGACPTARMLAERFGAELLVVYVADDRHPPLVVEYAAIGLSDLRERQHEHALRELDQFVERHLQGLPVETAVVDGVPHAEIVRVAAEREVDLIVMATHGRGFISHAVLGSTAERVVRRAPCPVLVVRPRADEQ